MKKIISITITVLSAVLLFAAGCEIGHRHAASSITANLQHRAGVYGTLAEMFHGTAAGVYYQGRAEAYLDLHESLK
jgi:hypothetical protein